MGAELSEKELKCVYVEEAILHSTFRSDGAGGDSIVLFIYIWIYIIIIIIIITYTSSHFIIIIIISNRSII